MCVVTLQTNGAILVAIDKNAGNLSLTDSHLPAYLLQEDVRSFSILVKSLLFKQGWTSVDGSNTPTAFCDVGLFCVGLTGANLGRWAENGAAACVTQHPVVAVVICRRRAIEPPPPEKTPKTAACMAMRPRC